MNVLRLERRRGKGPSRGVRANGVARSPFLERLEGLVGRDVSVSTQGDEFHGVLRAVYEDHIVVEAGGRRRHVRLPSICSVETNGQAAIHGNGAKTNGHGAANGNGTKVNGHGAANGNGAKRNGHGAANGNGTKANGHASGNGNGVKRNGNGNGGGGLPGR